LAFSDILLEMQSPATAPVRLPKNYQLILDVVQASGRGRHLTMSDVFAQTSARRPGIGYSTVYRGLVRLRELGLISEIVVPGALAATYEPAAERHAHFLCTRCSAIEDVEYALPTRVLRSVADKSGFDIAGGTVTFEGLCRDCRTGARTA
jgi:Fur family transcriptional regulator, stress-responsive regulator